MDKSQIYEGSGEKKGQFSTLDRLQIFVDKLFGMKHGEGSTTSITNLETLELPGLIIDDFSDPKLCVPHEEMPDVDSINR